MLFNDVVDVDVVDAAAVVAVILLP